MGMPRQLARGLRANQRRRNSTPPVIELMPSISINELRRVIPTRHGTYTQPDVSFKYPRIRQLRLTIDSIEIVDHFDRKQVFRIRWARTYFGRPRPIIECACTRRAIKLFSKFGTYACRKCHGAVYTSQRQDSKGRKRFKAAKLRLELGGLPNNREAMPPKRKWAKTLPTAPQPCPRIRSGKQAQALPQAHRHAHLCLSLAELRTCVLICPGVSLLGRPDMEPTSPNDRV
jgi:hypothetical protein